MEVEEPIIAEVKPLDIEKVIERLNRVSPNETLDLLNAEEKKSIDPTVGIVLVRLSDLFPEKYPSYKTEKGLEYHFYAARVLPHNGVRQSYVTPHYHKYGEEPYIIHRGEKGEMNRGRVENGKVVYERKDVVGSKETIVVAEGQVHSLFNPNPNQEVDFVFACPTEHLIDYDEKHPEGDRYIVKDLPGGIPESYFMQKA